MFDNPLLDTLRAIQAALASMGVPPAAAWAALVIVAAVTGFRRAGGHRKRLRKGLSGGMDGSGATLWRSAGAVTRRPGVSPLYGQPGWVRGLPLPLLTCLLWLYTASPGGLLALTVALACAACTWVIAKRRARRYRRVVIRPLFAAIAPMLGVRPDVELPGRWVTVPRSLLTSGRTESGESGHVRRALARITPDPVRVRAVQVRDTVNRTVPGRDRITVYVPETFTGHDSARTEIIAAVNRRVPGTWVGTWHMAPSGLRDRPRLELLRAPEPPRRVNYTALAYEGSPYHEVPLGLDTDGEPVHLDMANLAPHILVSASTGWAKTTTALGIVSYMYSRGAIVDICDPKRVGYLKAFRGLDAMTIHTDVDNIVNAISSAREEMEHRYSVAESRGILPDELDPGEFPPRLVVCDEMGSLVAMVKQRWQESGGKGQPPTYGDIMFLLWQGRAARFHVLTLCQQANAQVLISSDARDQYMCKIASGPQSLSAWRVMHGNAPKPRTSRRKGRAVVGIGSDDLTDVQLGYISDAGAREIALTRPGHLPVTSQADPHGEPPGETPTSVPGQQGQRARFAVLPGGLAQDREDAPIVGIGAAARHLGYDNPESFRKARQREPIPGEYRIGNSPAWTPLHLASWQSKRPKSGTGS